MGHQQSTWGPAAVAQRVVEQVDQDTLEVIWFKADEQVRVSGGCLAAIDVELHQTWCVSMCLDLNAMCRSPLLTESVHRIQRVDHRCGGANAWGDGQDIVDDVFESADVVADHLSQLQLGGRLQIFSQQGICLRDGCQGITDFMRNAG